MNPHIHPVVADTPCAKCGAHQWRRVGTKTLAHEPGSRDSGVVIETYECVNLLCPGVKGGPMDDKERFPWRLSWAHEGMAA